MDSENSFRVSILIPTLGRAQGLQRCLDSINQLYYPKHRIEVLIDSDPEATVPIKVNRMAQKAGGSILVFAANDMEFTPESLYLAVQESKLHGLVAFNAGPLLPDKGNICEHFLIRKDILAKLGEEIFCERFHHVGCDNLLWTKCEKLGEAIWLETAKIIHHHFSRTRQPLDEIYQRGWSQVENDRCVLTEELNKLEEVNK